MKKQLLAPNGNPSNLTPEQYKLVRTPAFKKWFGDWENDPENSSKVVDENGEPLILFHGTDVNFSVFDLSKIGEGSDLLGKGIYLTENKNVANFYANHVSKKRYIVRYEEGVLGSEVPVYEKDADKKAEKHKVIYEFFVKAKKIIDINEVEVDENIKQIIINSIIELFDVNSEKYVEDAIKYAHNNKEKIRNYRGVILYLIYRFPDTKEEIIKYIKNEYDCIIFEPTTEFESNLRGFNYKNYVVFEPNQIKLSNGTNTTFDANNDDIRFDNGGNVLLAPNGKPSKLTLEQYKLVRTPAFKKWFGDWENDPANASKVVDSNGEPLVVYHGTYADFTVFEGKYDNRGHKLIYFSSKKNVSKLYGENIKPFFLKINYLKSIYANSKSFNQVYDETMLSTIIKEVDISWYYDFEGLMIEDVYDSPDGKKKGEKGNTYAVKWAEQIKLADGTNTTFDANNDDIRFNNGGSVNDKYQYVVDEIKKAIIDLGLPYLNEVDEFNRYYLSKSKNDFGQSWYMIFLQESRPLEIRISDHTVTSSLRIKDEKYIAMLDISNPFKYLKPTGIAKSLDLEFKRLKDIAEKRNKLFDEEREKRDYMNNKLQPFLDKLKLENKSIGKNDRTYQTLEEIIIKHPDWEYIYHYPNNGAFSFYFVKNDKSGSLSPYFINEKYFDFLNDNGYLDNFKRGGRTIAQTPAPKKERIYGSNINKQKSSESNTSAKQIVFDEKTLKSIKNKIHKHNEENPDKKITLSSAKAVVRRGMGAYSKSHRPTIKGGKPNSRVAWGLARLNAFIYKIKNGVSKSGKYIQDDDLINELNIKYNIGGEISKQSINNVKNDKINYLNVLNSVWSFFGIKLD